MRALLVLSAACSAAPTASIDVALQRDTGTCWETIVHARDRAPAASGLGLEPFCPGEGSTALTGGSDRLRLLVVYEDIEFTTSSELDPPEIVVRLDGAVRDVAFDIVQRRFGDRTFVLATADAPPQAAGRVEITVSVTGLEQVLPTSKSKRISLVAPPLTVVDGGCTMQGCTHTGGVGTTPIDVTLRSRVGGDAVLTWTLDGIPQPESRTVKLVPQGDLAIGRDFTPIPISDKPWVITARLGNLVGTSDEIKLVAPRPTVTIVGCGTPCTVAPGSSRVVLVTAPRGIRSDEATLFTNVNGVPSLADVSIDLDDDNATDNTVEGVHTLEVPAQPGKTWTIDARVLGFRAPTFTATIGP